MDLDKIKKQNEENIKIIEIKNDILVLLKKLDTQFKSDDFLKPYRIYLNRLKNEFKDILTSKDFKSKREDDKNVSFDLGDYKISFEIYDDIDFNITTNMHSDEAHKNSRIGFTYFITDQSYPKLKCNDVHLSDGKVHYLQSDKENNIEYLLQQLDLLKDDIIVIENYCKVKNNGKFVVNISDNNILYYKFPNKTYTNMMEIISDI